MLLECFTDDACLYCIKQVDLSSTRVRRRSAHAVSGISCQKELKSLSFGRAKIFSALLKGRLKRQPKFQVKNDGRIGSTVVVENSTSSLLRHSNTSNALLV